VTARVPGTGISYRQPLHLPHPATGRPPHPVNQPAIPQVPIPAASTGTEIRSASTATLTSEGLEPVKQLLITAQNERAKLLPELRDAVNEAARLESKYQRWKNGWFLRRLFKR